MDDKVEKFLDEHPDCILLCPPRERDRAVAAGWPEDRIRVSQNVDTSYLVARELLEPRMLFFPDGDAEPESCRESENC